MRRAEIVVSQTRDRIFVNASEKRMYFYGTRKLSPGDVKCIIYVRISVLRVIPTETTVLSKTLKEINKN